MSRRVLVNQLETARERFCGIGTRKVKLRLNRCGDALGRAFRLALEIEDRSTQGKKYRGDWSDRNYWQKSQLINDLLALSKANGWPHGKQRSKGWPRWIVYFEIPMCEQISFHTDLREPDSVDDYAGEWDQKRNSTLLKLEMAIEAYLDEEQPALFI